MTTSFNLIKCNWIPLLPRQENHPLKLGLNQVLVEAHQFHSVQALTPLETVAIYRLLFAVLHATFDVTDEWWGKVWQDRRFPKSEIENYLNAQLSNFDLFAERRPFFQDETLNRKLETVSSLSGHLASGADATLFDHTSQSTPVALKPDEAARALLSIQAFGVGGTKGKDAQFTDAPCARGVLFLIEGDTLFETLMLNLYDRERLALYRLADKTRDRPAWELSDPFDDNLRRPYGLMDHLTWHNRRVRLIPTWDSEGNIMVREMMYAPGLPVVRETFNPMYHWRANTEGKSARSAKSRSHSPIAFQEDKALWRDSHTLLRIFSSYDETQDKPPYPLRWLRTHVPKNELTSRQLYKRVAFGTCTETGRDKTYFYRSEVTPLPLELLETNSASVGHIDTAISLAERVGNCLKFSTFNLARVLLDPTTEEKELSREKTEILMKNSRDDEAKRIKKLHDSWGAERYYWSGLEFHFHRLIQDLPNNADAALAEWRKQVWFAVYNAFAQVESYALDDRRALRALAIARQQFTKGINQLLPKPKQARTTEESEDGGEGE